MSSAERPVSAGRRSQVLPVTSVFVSSLRHVPAQSPCRCLRPVSVAVFASRRARHPDCLPAGRGVGTELERHHAGQQRMRRREEMGLEPSVDRGGGGGMAERQMLAHRLRVERWCRTDWTADVFMSTAETR